MDWLLKGLGLTNMNNRMFKDIQNPQVNSRLYQESKRKEESEINDKRSTPCRR